MSETLTNTQIIIKDDNGQIHTSKSLGQQDETRLNNMVKLMNSKNYVDSEVNKTKKEIGESVFSLIPLQNAGYHLYDGALIDGSGIYADFVAKIEELYTQHPEWNCWCKGELPFEQPVLSANGTLGGDSFAVSANTEFNSSYQAWKAFDGDPSTDFAELGTPNPSSLTFYNPEPLKVTQLVLTNRTTATADTFLTGSIECSDDGITWNELTTYTNSNPIMGGSWSIDLSSNTGFHKYYRIVGVSFVGDNCGFSNVAITATYQVSAEEQWQTCVTTYGACGKFVVDTTNHTVRLPKVTGIVEGTLDANALGDLVEAGLPNIEGQTSYFNQGGLVAENGFQSGCFSKIAVSGRTNSWSNSAESGAGRDLIFDASLSNSIYGNSNTVQPQTIKGYYYIVLANVTKTEIQVDIDNVVTDLNGKADVDLNNISNVSQTFKDKSIEWCFPDYSYRIEITSNTFTPQVDGYLMGKIYQSGNIFIGCENMAIVELYQPSGGEQTMTSLTPVKKGQTYTLTRNGTYSSIYFYSCLGAN